MLTVLSFPTKRVVFFSLGLLYKLTVSVFIDTRKVQNSQAF